MSSHKYEDVVLSPHGWFALEEFYQPAAAKPAQRRDQLEVTTCFAPLLTWILTGWQLTCSALALDATSLGDRGHAIPVAWKVLHAKVPHTPGSWSGSPCSESSPAWSRLAGR